MYPSIYLQDNFPAIAIKLPCHFHNITYFIPLQCLGQQGVHRRVHTTGTILKKLQDEASRAIEFNSGQVVVKVARIDLP